MFLRLSIITLTLTLSGCLGVSLNRTTPTAVPSVTAEVAAASGNLISSITRATSQIDTTGLLPITFDINFSTPVTGLTSSDISFSDDADLAFNITGSGSSYQLVVTSVDKSRPLLPTLKASSVSTQSGASNVAAVTADLSEVVAYRPLNFKQVVIGSSHTCGLTFEGVAYCWGNDTWGQLGNGAALTADQSSPSPVDTSALTAGDTVFTQLTAAGANTCGLTAKGVGYCWGSDTSGRLGNGAVLTANQPSPSPVDTSTLTAGDTAFIQITLGGAYACGLTSKGVAYCWGNDSGGRLGNGGALTADQASPSPVDTSTMTAGDTAFTQLAAGSFSTCGLTAKGVAYCWGDDIYGLLGNGAALTANQASPSPVDTTTLTAGDTNFTQLSVGYGACGITTKGAAYCWGSDIYGKLGNGAGITADQSSPSPVDTLTITGEKAFIQIVVQSHSSCGLTSEGVAYCWGSDTSGQLGNGAALTADQASPSPVDTSGFNGKIVYISESETHVCALTVAGTAYCWGPDTNGRLGNGAGLTANQASPSPVDTSALTSALAFKQVTAGAYHTCGLTGEGVAYCWGADTDGQLGNGTTLTEDQSSPSLVDTSTITGEKRFIQLAAGYYHTCGITSQGVAYCWGMDDSGELGNGGMLTDKQESPSPVDISNIAGEVAFTSIAAGGSMGCGITAEGVAYCWGYDGPFGFLGNGAGLGSEESPAPVDTSTMTAGDTTFVQITIGSSNSCGITPKGVAYCWGWDDSGRLGNGAGLTAAQQSPSPVDTSTMTVGDTAFVQLSAAYSHTCGLTAKGVAYCWGMDASGSLGNGAGSASQASPSPVDTTTITGEKALTQLTTGFRSSCAITSQGVAYCWGADYYGQAGNGAGITANLQSPSPVDTSNITGQTAFTQISSSEYHVCGLTSQGAIYCWGEDQIDYEGDSTYESIGKLGNGTTLGDESLPSAVDITAL